MAGRRTRALAVPRATRSTRVAVLAALLASTLLYASGSWRAQAHSNPWVTESEAGLSSNQAEAEGPNECEGRAGIPFGTDPGWVRVGGNPDPNTPFVMAEGQILAPFGGGPQKTNPFVTHTDFFGNHYSKDINIFLTPDKPYRHLLADGSFEEGDENEHGLLEIEWERGGIPMFAWPTLGDRMTVWGPHIWDCGHGDVYFARDQYRPEIHPPVGWVLFRGTSDQDGHPESGKQNQVVWNWYGPGDRVGVGAALPSSGLRNTVVQATVADAFFSSFGGNVPEALNGCDDDGTAGFTADNAPCMQSNEWRQSLLNQDYTFFVPAPPKPAGQVELLWSAEDRCSQVPSSPGNPPGDDVEDVGEASDSAENIGAPTCNIPDVVTPGTNNGRDGIWVTVDASNPAVGYPSNGYVAFAKRYKVAWDHVPTEAARARTYRVDVHQLRVYDDAEPCGEDGEWVMSLRVNEAWVHPVRGSGDDGDPFWSSGAIDDDKCNIGESTYQPYTIGETLTVSVVPGQPVNVWARTYDVDTFANDVLPLIDVDHFGPGSFESGTTSHSVEGAHTIVYTITDITPPYPTPGTLQIGAPTYGPNADTGGATRVGPNPSLTLVGSDAAELGYRFVPDGGPAGGWSFDPTSPLQAAMTVPDGTYSLQYAPVSAAGIVGPRRSEALQLDATPPVLTVPADIVADATEAAGAYVTYAATAVDNLPGPVSFSCDHPSGSLFPNGEVTTVTCTATDAVGNTSVQSFTIEVVSPFGYVPDFVVLGLEWAELGSKTVVESGNVGAFDSSGGVPNRPGVELVVGTAAQLQNGSQAVADTVHLATGVAAGDVFSVTGLTAGTGASYTPRVGFVPLWLSVPVALPATPGLAPLEIVGAMTVPPGNYGHVTLRPNAVLTLPGGDYSFRSLEIGPRAKLQFTGAAVVRIAERAVTKNLAAIGPAPGSAIAARDIVLHIAGSDSTGTKTAFEGGNNLALAANVYVHTGTLAIGSDSTATGAFIGRGVRVGSGVRLIRDSSFDAP